MNMKFYLLLGITLVMGFAIGWVDSGPNWDDTGITVVAIFGTALIAGILMKKYAWVWALAIGAWTPILSIVLHQKYESLVALAFAFAGAYLGSLLRKVGRLIHNV